MPKRASRPKTRCRCCRSTSKSSSRWSTWRPLDASTPLIHPELGDNLCFTRSLNVGEVDDAFAKADAVVETTFEFGRHTGVTLEPRCQIAEWNSADQKLTVYHSFQAPHMMQDLYARQFDLPESSIRVICKEVGGSFGIKVHAYPDDFATVALSMMCKRPVKFVADRTSSTAPLWQSRRGMREP